MDYRTFLSLEVAPRGFTWSERDSNVIPKKNARQSGNASPQKPIR
jgi:hypothetical protein